MLRSLVRPSLFFFLMLSLAALAQAQDARVAFLTKQLSVAKDPRVKTQVVLLLGQTASPDAVKPLCDAIRDQEPVVRTAAVNALAELKQPSALVCLKSALNETDASFRATLEKAIAALGQHGSSKGLLAPRVGGLYVHIEPVVDKAGLGDDTALAMSLLKDTLIGLGAAFAPEAEDKKAALALIKSKQLKAYQLRLQLLPGASPKALKVEMLIMTYPEQALQGSWNVKASGGDTEALIKAMVPRVVEDAADDLNWKIEGAH